MGKAFLILACVSSLFADVPPGTAAELGRMGSSQLLVVFRAKDGVRLVRFEKTGSSWRPAGRSIRAAAGYGGFALSGKREGDGKTPAGLFVLGTAFGYSPSIATRMPYRQATSEDYWIDDPASPEYNTWVRGAPRARSAEKMRRSDALYRIGLVIEYNTSPVVAGAGSAIFLHVWAGPGSQTSGCVAVEEAELARILVWLDPSRKPAVWIFPDFKYSD